MLGVGCGDGAVPPGPEGADDGDGTSVGTGLPQAVSTPASKAIAAPPQEAREDLLFVTPER